MVEFFGNIGHWFMENYKPVVMWLTSTQWGAILGYGAYRVYKWFRTRKEMKLADKLENSVKSINSVSDKVNNTDTIVSTMQAQIDEMRTRLTEYENIATQKINAILEVQSIVYATVKDDSVRSTVSAVLTNAKHLELKEPEKTASVPLKEVIENVKTVIEAAPEVVETIGNVISRY